MWTKLTHYHKRYLGIGYRDRTMLLSIGSFAVNAVIGAGKLLLGIFLRSPRFVATAVYYLLLCAARGQLLWRGCYYEDERRVINQVCDICKKHRAVHIFTQCVVCAHRLVKWAS